MLVEPLIEKIQKEQERFAELEETLGDPSCANDLERLKNVTQEHARLAPTIKKMVDYLKTYQHWEQAQQLSSEEETDKTLRNMAKEEARELEEKLKEEKKNIEFLFIPHNPHEGRNIYIEIRSGTGGEEASLFVADLMRMYMRFAEQKELKIELIHSSPTELGGYKEVIFAVRGEKAYHFLHQEGGIHRVQRIPSTESNGRIHTSAVTVAVLPERDESEVTIQDSDLQIDVFRASGAGGQHINKTESAIRITHIPSGIVVSCQDERSQHKNKARAMNVLRSRLAEIKEREAHQEENALKREQIKSGDRSERIRTYNFPQGRITDHRISYTAYNLEALVNGEMDGLLSSLIQTEKESLLQNL